MTKIEYHACTKYPTNSKDKLWCATHQEYVPEADSFEAAYAMNSDEDIDAYNFWLEQTYDPDA